MQDVNHVTLAGTVKQDAIARRVREGLRSMDFTLVTCTRGKPVYVDCVAYGRVVDEQLEGFVNEGERIEVEGSLSFRTMTAQDGTRRTRSVVYVERAEPVEGE